MGLNQSSKICCSITHFSRLFPHPYCPSIYHLVYLLSLLQKSLKCLTIVIAPIYSPPIFSSTQSTKAVVLTTTILTRSSVTSTLPSSEVNSQSCISLNFSAIWCHWPHLFSRNILSTHPGTSLSLLGFCLTFLLSCCCYKLFSSNFFYHNKLHLFSSHNKLLLVQQ